MLQRILDTAAERSWQVTSVNLDTLTEPAFVKLLSDMDNKKDYQIIIDCELDRLNSILNLVKHQPHCGRRVITAHLYIHRVSADLL